MGGESRMKDHRNIHEHAGNYEYRNGLLSRYMNRLTSHHQTKKFNSASLRAKVKSPSLPFTPTHMPHPHIPLEG